MSTRELKQWLSKRRESRILKRIRDHLIYVDSCIVKGQDFYKFWIAKDEEGSKNMYEIIHQEEKTADKVEAEIIDMLSEGQTPEYVRSDLMNFIRLADRAAGNAKRGVKNLLVLINHEFPKGINELIGTIFDKVAEEIDAFIKVFDSMFKVEIEELKKLISKVDNLESDIDKLYADLKYEIAYNSEKVPAGALIILDHAIKDLEDVSDLVEDCADMVRSIVLL